MAYFDLSSLVAFAGLVSCLQVAGEYSIERKTMSLLTTIDSGPLKTSMIFFASILDKMWTSYY